MIQKHKSKKHKTITRLLKVLKRNMDFQNIDTMDHWDTDIFVLWLRKKDKLVYISTRIYCINKKRRGEITYGYDLEILDEKDESSINVIKEVDAADEETLIQDIKQFLEV